MPDLRAVDPCAVVPRALELPHLAADHLVARPRVAADVDLPHVHPATRVDVDGERRLVLFAVDLGDHVDVRKGVAFRSQAVADPLGGHLQFLPRIRLARSHGHEATELELRHGQIACEPDVGDAERLALEDVDRDVDVLLVRRDRHLRRLDVELEVAAILIEAAQRLEVGAELLLRVLVVLRVPGEPAGRRELHFRQQLRFGERLVADDVDPGNLRRIAFDDVEVDGDAVALLRRDRRRHLRCVPTARDVLTLHLLLRAIQRGTVENLRLGEADVAQRFLEGVRVEFLVPGDIHLADRRSLLDDDDQHAVVDLEPDVAEETCSEQRLHCRCRLRVVDPLADLDRQIGEDRARFGALHALDADILDDERLEGVGESGSQSREECREERGDRAETPWAPTIKGSSTEPSGRLSGSTLLAHCTTLGSWYWHVLVAAGPVGRSLAARCQRPRSCGHCPAPECNGRLGLRQRAASGYGRGPASSSRPQDRVRVGIHLGRVHVSPGGTGAWMADPIVSALVGDRSCRIRDRAQLRSLVRVFPKRNVRTCQRGAQPPARRCRVRPAISHRPHY